MKILYYNWDENSSEDIKTLFQTFGYGYTEMRYKIKNYDTDAIFEKQVDQILSSTNFDMVFTFNYFPILSKIAQRNHIPYVSWVYDCPHLTLYSKTITNSYNYIFLFDGKMYEKTLSLGAKHAFHLPLAVSADRLYHQLSLHKQPDFLHEISFVGSLYENNMYRQIQYLPDYISGYLEGIMNSQQKIWGYNFVEDLLTTDIITELQKYVTLDNNPNYLFTPTDFFANLLNSEITHRDRSMLLTKVSDLFYTDLYSASSTQYVKNCHPHGFISYMDEMPRIFNSSKINLNISLRSITQGIPLRCMDIMGAGGFLLSNFQPELAEFFVPNEEFVHFDSDDDLLEKISFYIEHKDERMEIAKNGCNKVHAKYSYSVQFQKILQSL